MATPPRKRTIKEIKSSQSLMLQSMRHTPHFNNIEERLHNLNVKANHMLRKVPGSSNSVKALPTIARILFGLHQDLIHWGLPEYAFGKEKAIVNEYLRSYLDERRRSRYSKKCSSYGETLLNCYLDSFITLTVMKTPKEIGAKPSFLVNPSTGSLLELDVLFEDFRLAFELQGEHHYVDPKVMGKDGFKLAECHRKRKVLIPINLGQLQSVTIQDLVANSIKDALKLHDVVALHDPAKYVLGSASQQELSGFKKAVQRIYLASELFDVTFAWLDSEAASYIAHIAARSPISVATSAPRWSVATPNVPMRAIYGALRSVSAIGRAS